MTKQSLSPVWKKILIGALALLAVGVASFTAYAIIENERSKAPNEYDEDLFINAHVIISGHYKNWDRQYCTMRNRISGKTIIKRFYWYGADMDKSDTLIVYFDFHDKRGYVDVVEGKVVIPAQYEHAWNFSEGLGAITRDNKVGFINSKGEEIIPCQFPTTLHAIQRFGFAFHDGLCVMTNERSQCGIINRQGEWVIEPTYDCIWNANKAGLRIVQNDGLYGIMDRQGKILLPIQYDQITDYDNYYLVEQKGVRFTMGYDFKVINPFVCDHIYTLYYADRNDIEHLTDFCKYHIGYNEGIINRQRQIIIPAIYYQIELVTPTVFRARLKDCDSWILLDDKGKEIEIK